MAARVLLQRHAAPLTASLVAGSIMLYPRAALAEAPDSYTPIKKPIYDDLDAVPTTATLPPARPSSPSSTTSTTVVPENPASPSLQEVVVHTPQQPQQQQARGPTPTDRLASQVREARLFLYRHACNAEDALNRTMDRAFHLERSFTDTVAGLAPRAETGEKLMPGLVYVLVAAMAGSMVTRRSNILLRATVPVAFGVAMGWTALPVTMGNVSELAWRYEQRFPVVAQSHIKTREAWTNSVQFAEAHRRVVVDAVDDKVKSARETVEDWVKKGK
ncbi:apolipo protein O-domain-containing protein [Coniella lustricola]|uniref:MICOS complex subunit n=1 Tax=Coniella lustricola TaxID=2025994 RepID=A0A2T2ZV83_9PEZI|nr:apolipo protein O-domain-containing protein [Coniella lustricola]